MSDMFVIYPKLVKKLFDQLQIFINTKFIILFNSKVLWDMENCPTGKLASVTSPGKLPPTLTLSQTFTLILIQTGEFVEGQSPGGQFYGHEVLYVCHQKTRSLCSIFLV